MNARVRPAREVDMMSWKRIMCAVDFSEPSRIALDGAAALAARLGAELTLVHVQPAASCGDGSAEETMERWCSDAEAVVGTPVRARVVTGEAAPEILREARESGCELLIVGRRERTGLSRLVLGSVAEELVRSAPCPVLIARADVLVRADEVEEAALYA
jgi:nucleotide-binding universal stress UspA family protein